MIIKVLFLSSGRLERSFSFLHLITTPLFVVMSYEGQLAELSDPRFKFPPWAFAGTIQSWCCSTTGIPQSLLAHRYAFRRGVCGCQRTEG